MSLGWQVLAAARARDAGMEVNKILEMLEELKNETGAIRLHGIT